MVKRGSGIPLRARVRTGGVPSGAAPLWPRCPARHCGVADAVDGDGEKRPGLLLEWRQRDRRWEGLVVYAARIRPHGWGLVQEWIPAELLPPGGVRSDPGLTSGATPVWDRSRPRRDFYNLF